MFAKAVTIFLANYLIFIVIGCALFYSFRLSGKELMRFVLICLLSGLLALLLAHIASIVFYNPRPFVRLHVTPLVPHGLNNGFPSDHMLVAALAASIIFLKNRKLGILLWIMAISIGIARVIALVHSPIDIIASILIAVVSVLIASIASHHLVLRFSKNEIG